MDRKCFKGTYPFVNSSAKRKNKNKRKKRKNKQKAAAGCSVKKPQEKQTLTIPSKNICFAMASWAQTYSKMLTWQSKHEVSYWKAKATALEYENRILHDIIRKKHLVNASVSSSSSECSENENEQHEDENNDSEFEVSQEYIEFLIQNQKYRDDAKKERAKFAAQTSNQDDMEELPLNKEVDIEEMKNMYGTRYKNVKACEMIVDKGFIEAKDRLRPQYWPSTPFNLNV